MESTEAKRPLDLPVDPVRIGGPAHASRDAASVIADKLELTFYTHRIPGHAQVDILGFDCRVKATIVETVDTRTGDVIEHITIDEIIAAGSGQTILPISLTSAQLRNLVNAVRDELVITS